jgi:hypothetical protein
MEAIDCVTCGRVKGVFSEKLGLGKIIGDKRRTATEIRLYHSKFNR